MKKIITININNAKHTAIIMLIISAAIALTLKIAYENNRNDCSEKPEDVNVFAPVQSNEREPNDSFFDIVRR